MSRIVLGVSGGIAAYKACELLRLLVKHGHDVTVIPTPAALNFVGSATWEALSGNRVHTDVWSEVDQVRHVKLGVEADLVIVAPATADLVARAATGRADDLLTATLLTATCPVVFAPAMHTQMWQHPATTHNVATLRRRGAVVLEPDSGRLTGADSGPGRLPEPQELFAYCQLIVADAHLAALAAQQDLVDCRVLVSAGGTREALDPVRYLSNASSGRMGIGIARAARLRGADVTVVTAHVIDTLPSGATAVPVSSTAEMARAMQSHAPTADIVIMAAAPADYTVADPRDTKIKKSGSDGMSLDLVQTTDILAGLAAQRHTSQVLVGFAAETASGDELLQLGRSKLQRKGCDLLVLNDVSQGKVFGSLENTVTIIDGHQIVAHASGSKDIVGHHILTAAHDLFLKEDR